ncbi:hypothetical protein CLOSTMETH_02916 [[Clostridium] methylpentosum DSM 5476]|uniref:Uncharacterized protein n=1 Tax=[Clostridium] methylpentosum DSM 5476 TaxID=537013 RepID=C0EGC3_9FIRM|nr:hypothetical protein CLOSTMETH_02916 [[Clostridium] methylpentosum DSM 5476]
MLQVSAAAVLLFNELDCEFELLQCFDAAIEFEYLIFDPDGKAFKIVVQFWVELVWHSCFTSH